MLPRVSYPSEIPPGGRELSPEERATALADMEALVRRSHLFKSLDEAGRESLLSSGYVVSFASGEELVRQDEPGDLMYIVLSGRVHIGTRAAAGDVGLAELGRGACIGEVAVLTGAPRTATVTALTDVDAMAFARHRIERVLDEYPKVRELLLTLVEHRARDTVEKIIG
jgi:CRP-like cAMP-binding protein